MLMTIPIIENIKKKSFSFFSRGGGGCGGVGGRLFFYLVDVKNDWGSLAF